MHQEHKRDLEFETRFYESVLRRDRSYVDVIELLGGLYTKQGRVAEYDAVKDTVDEVAERAPQYHREREPEPQRFPPGVVQVCHDGSAGDDGKEGEEELPPDINPECHPGVLDVREAEEIPQQRTAGPVGHASQQDSQGGERGAFDEQLGGLVGGDDDK